MFSGVLIGYSLGELSKKNKFARDIIEASYIIILLFYVTRHIVNCIPGIILLVTSWIVSLYYIEIGILGLIKEISETQSSNKQKIFQAIKTVVEILSLYF